MRPAEIDALLHPQIDPAFERAVIATRDAGQSGRGDRAMAISLPGAGPRAG